MERVGEQWLFSPSDLVGFAGCQHVAQLERRAASGQLTRPRRHNRGLEALIERGRAHEERHLSGLEADGKTVTRITFDWKGGRAAVEGAARATTEAMRRGDRVIHQATFLDDGWRGHVDFLERVECASALGAWSYEPADAKLARQAKPAAVVQLCGYADAVARVQGRLPDRIHLILGGAARPRESLRLSDFFSYYRWLKAEFLSTVMTDAGQGTTYPEPVESCETCRWSGDCDKQRRADDHLSLVANIRRKQRDALVGRGVAKLADLATLALPVAPPLDTNPAALERVRDQARIQLRGRTAGRTVHERLTGVDPTSGLGALPAPDAGDLFLDLEGDPFVGDEGMEYLFGLIEPGSGPSTTDAALTYHEFWAHDRAMEKRAFENAVDLIRDRRARHPNMHVYHYAPYEVTAFKRLMSRHGTREDEVDEFLRAGIFVDLLRVVRQSILASVESYSIKALEPLYAFERAVPLKDAGDCRADLESWLELGAAGELDADIRERVRLYNRDDCVSAYRLRDWLEGERAALVSEGVPLVRPAMQDGAASEGVAKAAAEVAATMERLLAGLPEEESERSEAQQAQWLLAQLLEWHRRDRKADWWEFHRLRELGADPEALIPEGKPIGALTYVGIHTQVARSNIHRFTFPEQDHGLEAGKEVCDPANHNKTWKIYALDPERRFLDLKRDKKDPAPVISALIPAVFRGGSVQADALLRIATWFADNGIDAPGKYGAARALLGRHAPDVGQAKGAALHLRDGDLLSTALGFADTLADGRVVVLPIQGPPGTGKTFTGARLIVALARKGKRVGITAGSHQVIKRLLEEVMAAARETPLPTVPIQISSDDPNDLCPGVVAAKDNADALTALEAGRTHIVGATVWPWSNQDFAGAVDVLFIDEAGQMSLANAVAASQATRSLVLLGDPQQLNQPSKGAHPPGADASALGHILDRAFTLDATRGLFIDETWRLHPDLCAFTSDLYYEGRLRARPELAVQHLDAAPPLGGAGIRIVTVEHHGNQNQSSEEAAEVLRLFGELLKAKATWFEKGKPVTRTLGVADILVVAPYNAHVNLLRRTLPPGARVGTVDKFQGQEAPAVIYALASSSPEDAPRGMEFLYDPHRLNVATSRARCVAVLVASPALFAVTCRTVRQLLLANGFCRVGEAVGHRSVS